MTFVFIRTGEDEVQEDGASPVPDVADGGKVNVQDQETDAAQETGHAHSDAIVTGVGVVVEDAEQALAADVDVALVHDAAEHHHGENLQAETRGPGYYLTGEREWTHTGVWMSSHSSYRPHNTNTVWVVWGDERQRDDSKWYFPLI